MAKLTPMMEQYFKIKEDYKDCILFFRLGDFYEMFYEDAILASKELEISLTGKSCGQEQKAPMCGVPFHSAESYISKLVEKGYKVAICEQTENPKDAKGVVKREVIRVVTPGTILDNAILDETKNNYMMSIYLSNNKYGIAIVDISTGEFLTTQLNADDDNKLIDEIGRFNPSEIICNDIFMSSNACQSIKNRFDIFINEFHKWSFEYSTAYKNLCAHFSVVSLDGYGLRDMNLSVCASGALILYLIETQKTNLAHILNISIYSNSKHMTLDISSRRNLELTETLREKSRRGSLLWVLDRTKSVLGARMLRKWIEEPLIDINEIKKRLDSVEELKSELLIREELKEYLKTIYDIERLMTRIVYETANARDLVSLKTSIQILPYVYQLLNDCESKYLNEIYKQFDLCEDIYLLIDNAIVEEAPFSVREGGLIKDGYNAEIDKLREAKNNGTTWLAELESTEKEKTKIKNLKIRYNKIFGYYIEVTNSYLNLVPDRYIRKQTVANAERFITPELKQLEETILGAEEKIVDLEYKLFSDVRNQTAQNVKRLKMVAHFLATIDVLQSLAEVADKEKYTKPEISDDGILDIKEGRHPVVEKMMEQFIPNDTYLDLNNNRLSIITGPNMAGKSTYMRQVALITLMAQIGSFVPADNAHISVVDRIFTRVGASDDLASGQSTFMVEMAEVSNILRNATKNSLLILDEIGRGTSTFDGLSIAWAVLEYIGNKSLGAKTLFSTHYHELTELEGKIEGVVNYCIEVKEANDSIVFLRKIKKGGASNSYGIQVAQLAGLPRSIVERAKEILAQLTNADITKNVESKDNILQSDVLLNQIADKIKSINIMNLTPLEAIEILSNIQQQLQ